MPNLFDRLVVRAWHPDTAVQPRMPSRFESPRTGEPGLTGFPADGLSSTPDAQSPVETGYAEGARLVLPVGEPGRLAPKNTPPLSAPIARRMADRIQAPVAPVDVVPPARGETDAPQLDEISTRVARVSHLPDRRTPRGDTPSASVAPSEPREHASSIARSRGLARETPAAPVAERTDPQPIRVTTGTEPLPTAGRRGDDGNRLLVRDDSALLVPAQDRLADVRRRPPTSRDRVAESSTPPHLTAASPSRQPAEAPVIQVTIGRVEIRATLASSHDTKRTPRAPMLGLDAYLRQRNGGRS